MADPDEGNLALGPLSESLGFLLRLAQLEAFRDFFDGLPNLEMRPGEMSVLMLISENPGTRQGILARNLMIKRAHMTKMVQIMDEAGLIRRTVPASDRRAVELWLTEAGAARIAEIQPTLEAHEARAVAGLNAGEAAELKRLLRKYVQMPGRKGGA